MSRTTKNIVKVFLFLSVFTLQLSTETETVSAYSNGEVQAIDKLVLYKTVNNVEVDEKLSILEDTYLYGIRRENEVVVQFGEEELSIPLDAVETEPETSLYQADSSEHSLVNLEVQEDLVFRPSKEDSTSSIQIKAGRVIPLYKDEVGSKFILIGQLRFYLVESETAVNDEVTTPYEEEEITEQANEVEVTDPIEEVNEEQENKVSLPGEEEAISDESEGSNAPEGEQEGLASEQVDETEQEINAAPHSMEQEVTEKDSNQTKSMILSAGSLAAQAEQVEPAYKPWTNETDDYFKVMVDNATVYDNRSGSLKPIGSLTKNEVYYRIKDYGRDWHQIQYGDIYGYVYKPATTVAAAEEVPQRNTKHNSQERKFQAIDALTVYDNSTGHLNPFGVIFQGQLYPVASDYGDWWRVLLADRVGYVYKGGTKLQFLKDDEFFRSDTSASVYNNRTGRLVEVGTLVKGETYRRVKDYGKDWHQIQFGDDYGYVYKPATSVADGSNLKNLDRNSQESERSFEAQADLTVYDNSTGALVPFGVISEGTQYSMVSDYGPDWLEISFANRIGYVYQSSTIKHFIKEDEFFKAATDLDIYDNRTGTLRKVGKLLQGQVYRRVKEYGPDWHQIIFGNDFGYVYKPSTSVAHKSEIENPNNANLNVLGVATPDYSIEVYSDSSQVQYAMAEIDKGTTLSVFSEENGFWKVSLAGRFGYIAKSEVTFKETPRTVFLDPGHGGWDSGASYYGINEKDINLVVSKKVKSELEKLGYKVIMSRDDDSYLSLLERSKLANNTDANIFVSIHHNALPWNNTVQGIETYYYKYYPEYPSQINQKYHNDPTRIENSRLLANLIQDEMVKASSGIDRGVRRNTFSVLRETKTTAVLLELGYMSSYSELQKLINTSYQNKLISGIVTGIDKYFKYL